jgi:hypothetical protein
MPQPSLPCCPRLIRGREVRRFPDLPVLKSIIKRIEATAWMRNATNDDDALHVFREKPAMQAYCGIGLILVSYVIGWPVVAILTMTAFYIGEPLILAIGGPLFYGFSHLVFLAGLYLAGKRYAIALAHWASRKALARLSGGEN